ncbi:ABC transporter permease [Chitinophaga sp.]|uniref:ABC transporter permease n=1 Tax=Chitinophaga sp. TaxID=1869181 RepID=UPI0031E38672
MFKNYLRIAFRNLFSNKVYGLLNILGLALSMTCGLLIFVLVKYHLSFDNFHKNANRIYQFVTEQHRENISYTGSVPPAFAAAYRQDFGETGVVARAATYSEALVAYDLTKFIEAEGVSFVDPTYFDIFNFPLLTGKNLLAEPNTVLITASLAKKYFGKEDPINKVIKIENKLDARVTGILKDLPGNTDQRTGIFISFKSVKNFDEFVGKENNWNGITSTLKTYVRLLPGVSTANLEKQFPKYRENRKGSKNIHVYHMLPLQDRHFDARYGGTMEKRSLWILTFAGLFLIVTACLNFINLSTAQALRRSKEVGIRKALGSFRVQLFWQFLMETGIIVVIATVVAIVLAASLLTNVNSLFDARMSWGSVMDVKLLAFIAGMILIVTLFAGSYPGLILSGFRPALALKGKVSMQQVGSFNIRRTLIVTQFTITLILIIGMLVITRQMQYTRQADLGFNKDAVLMVPMGADSLDANVTSLKNELMRQAGVKNVSVCFEAPSSWSSWNTNIRIVGDGEDEPFTVDVRSADEQYVSTFGLQLIAGRDLFPDSSARECIVNEIFMHKLNLKSPQELIGQQLSFNGGEQATIVGVVKNFHMHSLHDDIGAVMITPYNKFYQNFAIKLNMGQLTTTIPTIEKLWSARFPGKLFTYKFFDKQIAEFYKTEETMLRLVSIFSVIAIFIGCLGLYGLISFMVMQKTKEIGIRKVLGSSIGEILWIFGKEFAVLILLAFCLAAPVAWWMMNRWLEDFKFHVSLGPWTFVGAVGLTMIVAGLTVSFQSVKAALMNPVRSLKME